MEIELGHSSNTTQMLTIRQKQKARLDTFFHMRRSCFDIFGQTPTSCISPSNKTALLYQFSAQRQVKNSYFHRF
jgi:hypothetical protein